MVPLVWRSAWLFLAILAACAASAGVDIARAPLGSPAPAISIAAGIGLVGLVLGGIRLWPAVPLGTFVALHAVGTYSAWAEIIIPLGDGLTAAGGAMVLRRWALKPDLARLRDALALLGVCVLAATVAALAHDVVYNLVAGSES